MLGRSIWNGYLGFGLVNIPVKVFAATQDREFHFHTLHRECGHRIQLSRYCPSCERRLEASEMVRAYPLGGKYVVIEDSELEALPVKSAKVMQIVSFVEPEEVADPRLPSGAFYILPDKGGEKPFQLLVKAMERTRLTAVVKWAHRGREFITALCPFGGALVAQTIRYPDEVRELPEGSAPQTTFSDEELSLAETLVKALKRPFEHSSFHDEYREALQALIQKKAAGQVIERVEAAAPQPASDLAQSLAASLKALGMEVR
jgi:DNA end-binding protein Ku